jgi:hypothetical protein
MLHHPRDKDDGNGSKDASTIEASRRGRQRNVSRTRPAEMRDRLRAVAAAGERGSQVLTPDDLDSLERLGIAASAALLLDLGSADGQGDESG